MLRSETVEEFMVSVKNEGSLMGKKMPYPFNLRSNEGTMLSLDNKSYFLQFVLLKMDIEIVIFIMLQKNMTMKNMKSGQILKD